MMFIEHVTSKIWESTSQVFKEVYDEASKLSAEELFEKVRDDKMGHYQYTGVNMNLLNTCGCPHRLKPDRLSGCSFCDYHSESIVNQGKMAALLEKSPDLYAKALRHSFINVRGEKAETLPVELITGYDFFNSREIPEKVYEELFASKDLFNKKPFMYVFETRAGSVTYEKLMKLKQHMGPRDRIDIEMGVETSDEWIRNHWLNKGTTNHQIINAIQNIKRAGFYVSTDLILGIPGLTERQSVEIFKETVLWLDNMGVDKIICLPLNRKERTLHGYLHKKLSDNERLLEVGPKVNIQVYHGPIRLFMQLMKSLRKNQK